MLLTCCFLAFLGIYLIGLHFVNIYLPVKEPIKNDDVQNVVVEGSANTKIPEITTGPDKKELEKIDEGINKPIININTATNEELCKIDGIGEKFAQRIIDKRNELGGFTSIEQLKDVKGIGEKTFEKIKPQVVLK
ncbi:MAG: helix-hairpin-helix domain-containing protein [Oscillospiraceae bacterium]